MTGGKRILMLTKDDHRQPRSGGPLRTFNVAACLTRAGFRVDVLSMGSSALLVRADGSTVSSAPRPPVGSIVRLAFEAVRDMAPELRHRVRRDFVGLLGWAQSVTDYDLVVVEFSQLAIYRPLIQVPAVLDLHNIESALMANYADSLGAPSRAIFKKLVAARLNARGLRRLEARMSRAYESVAVVSDNDAMTLTQIGGLADAVVAPNGVSDDAFARNDPREQSVVFVSYLGWPPNIDAAIWLARSVWPLVVAEVPGTVLQLVGREPSESVRELAGPGIEVHGDVPDVYPYVGRASVATAPLLAAGGTRLKILEALGVGTPVVATPMGALGLESLRGENMHIAADATAFAASIVHFLRQGSSLDRADIRAAAEPYRWSNALRPLVERCRELAG